MGTVVGLGLVLAAITIAGIAISLYNRLVFLKHQCDKAWGNIDVLLKQRHDEIPKLVAVIEGAKSFERDTLERVIKARAAATQAVAIPDRAKAEGELSNALGRLLAVAEQYPDLKSVALFGQLSARVTGLESEIADRREFYNDAVMQLNVAIDQFPTNLMAGTANAKPRDLFKVAAADITDPKIEFK